VDVSIRLKEQLSLESPALLIYYTLDFNLLFCSEMCGRKDEVSNKQCFVACNCSLHPSLHSHLSLWDLYYGNKCLGGLQITTGKLDLQKTLLTCV